MIMKIPTQGNTATESQSPGLASSAGRAGNDDIGSSAIISGSDWRSVQAMEFMRICRHLRSIYSTKSGACQRLFRNAM